MEPQSRKLQTFIGADGKAPFEKWFGALKDKTTKARIATRLDRLRLGNFGDCKSVGAGVLELRINTGPGYRVYFGLLGSEIVLLLGGGDKSTQQKDIKLAQTNWRIFSYGKAQNKKN